MSAHVGIGPACGVVAGVGAGLLGATVLFGYALRNNQVGTDVDRWFQRVTEAGSAWPPGQPPRHPRVFHVASFATHVGHMPDLAVFAFGTVVLVAASALFAYGFDVRGRAREYVWWLPVAIAPLVAAVVAGLSAEHLLKPAADRRMLGNITILTYPSGHATGTAAIAAAALVGLVGALRVREADQFTTRGLRQDPRQRSARIRTSTVAWVLLTVALVGPPLLAGTGMAVIRSHFLTDVVGGWAWGAGWGLVTASTALALSRRGAYSRMV